ncbi:ABC-F family ATP-binding cassette domain-containing protein [Vibrio paucivorans]
MPLLLQTHHLTYQFANGETLLSDISVSLSESRVGLVGRNGVGKSVFLSLLMKHKAPSSGTVSLSGNVGYYSQSPSTLIESSASLAEFLKVDDLLTALTHIEAGSSDPKWFEIVGDNWGIRQALSDELLVLGLPTDLDFPCCKLSGGQLAKLQLSQLFKSNVDLLILDEPTNHMDGNAKNWLIEQIQAFPGYVLVVSHDRQLLRSVNQIWELSQRGLIQYGGNYDFYREQKDLEARAVERQLLSVSNQQKRLEQQAQKDQEKADKRAAQGNKIRKQGGQPKILLNAMRSSATKSASNRRKNESGRREFLEQKASELQSRHEQLKAQKLYMDSEKGRGKRLFSIVDGVLPFGCNTPLTLQLNGGSKMRLSGGNGCGKSTLLKVLQGEVELMSGELQLNTPVYYLDQHFGVLNSERTMLDNLTELCPHLPHDKARTLLAGIGFRRDSVYRTVCQVSGGEKMKLSMLVVSHQKEQPLLLLDEPDNHLDIDSKVILANALKAYKGAFVLISHDEDFAAESGVALNYEL